MEKLNLTQQKHALINENKRTTHKINKQEGQHPLTGHRAANFRLLANQ